MVCKTYPAPLAGFVHINKAKLNLTHKHKIQDCEMKKTVELVCPFIIVLLKHPKARYIEIKLSVSQVTLLQTDD
jgi:hypothetical protein